MSEPYLGQVVPVGFNFAPVGWALCDGSVLPIAQNAALFTLLGTSFGGNGQTTFGLPDLRGRAVVSQGQGVGLESYIIGEETGIETVTLTAGQFAGHSHGLSGAGTVDTSTPGSTVVFGTTQSVTSLYASSGATTALAAKTVTVSAAQGLPHDNRQPYTTVNYIIALEGVFPSRS